MQRRRSTTGNLRDWRDGLLVSVTSAYGKRCFAAMARESVDRNSGSALVALHLTNVTGESVTLVRQVGHKAGIPVVIACGFDGQAGESVVRQAAAAAAVDMWLAGTTVSAEPTAPVDALALDLEHEQAVAVLAHICGRPEISGGAFLCCAEAIRRLRSSAVQVPSTRMSQELREVLQRPPHRQGLADQRVRALMEGLRHGTGPALERAQIDWAALLGVNAAHLGRLVYAHTGVRFRDWRRAYRMKRATQLLARDNEQVAQIAFAVGFNDASQFGREFRALFGLTPRAFRAALHWPLDGSRPQRA